MKLKTNLLPWQGAAVEKLIGIRVGALYMEMGTGKTRTALEMIQRRLDAGKLDHVLWLCPCSVRENLREDIRKHADGALAKIAIYGIESLSGSDRLMPLLISYCMAASTMLIVDESNLVKNWYALRTKRIYQLSSLCKYRLILNGTPISKNEADLFSQWYILDWRILGYQSFWSFAANHLEYDDKYRHKVRRVLNVDYLTDKIAPYSYMVSKDEVLSLPDKNACESPFWMTDDQEEHYGIVMDEFLEMLISEDDDAAIYRTFTALQEVASGRRIVTPAAEPIRHESFFNTPDENPRIQELLSVIEGNPDEKTIIWCKFQHEIDDIQNFLRSRFGEQSSVIFCGKISQRRRVEAIEAFKRDARFLIANKSCAGYGLNLQFCRRAIYYNNDWNWATRAQSEDRIHRIGQSQKVMITDICASSTIDMRILDCLTRKTRLSDEFKGAIKEKNPRAWLRGTDVEGLNDKARAKRER